MISLIVAMDNNRLIGKENDLPWRLPADLQYFKQTTMGHTIVMGRKTFESIGKPLPNRRNVILTGNKDYHHEGVKVIHSVDDLMSLEEESELFVIGGATVYEQTMNVATRLYVTHIEEAFEGDTYFPEINSSVWKEVSKKQGIKDEKNPYVYYFTVYERS